ncbi:hypothetical protein HOD05_00710 [Candidatus Woesearchaeota archaeon]|jgi:hypothetical protein|nr:hypothetical protein [Candidatus Woesearchaeota archaeon]MBT4150927.1 hypothetical protein [Candidatus Woesearchaeota archaeon]MBT4247098.1 hypothetical protein [Candidatus Woesearchaeota archaeon]MBT4433717.1 hypothetical protein [Candidatus Woesearchaeota archaeon]
MSFIKNIKTLETSSPTFAYILGTVYGDGHVRVRKSKNRTSGEIILKVNDEDFAKNFKNHLEEWSSREAKLFFYGKRYISCLYSKEHTQKIINFEPTEILSKDKNFKHAFLRGLFDSDGGIIGRDLNNRTKAKRWLHFSNSDAIIIYLVKRILNEFNIKYSFRSRIHSGFGSEKIQYEIKIYNFNGIKYYFNNIGFSIGRKQRVLNKVINSYRLTQSKDFNRTK